MDRKQSLKILKELSETPDQKYYKDIVFKMSKKIAQLTKVIYFLNTRNEDMELNMKIMKTAYEAEINNTVQDGAAIIKGLNEKLAEANQRSALQDNVIEQNMNIISKHEATIKENRLALEKVEQEAAKKIAAAEAKIKEAVTTNAALKEKVASVKDLAEKEKVGQLEALEWEHEKEIKRIYEANLAEDAKLKRALRESEAKILTITNEKQVAIQEVMKSAAVREKEIKDGLESDILSNRNTIEKLTGTISKLESTIKDLNEDLKRKRESINFLENEKYDQDLKIASQLKQIEKCNDEYADIKSYLDSTTELLNSYYLKYPELESKFAQLQSEFNQLAALKQQSDTSLQATEKDLSNAKDVIVNTQQELNTATSEIEALNVKLQTLQKSLESANESIEKLNFQILANQRANEQDLKSKLAELQTKMEKIRHEEVIKQSAIVVKEKDAIIADREKEIEALNSKISDEEAKHEKLMEAEVLRYIQNDKLLKKDQISSLELAINTSKFEFKTLKKEYEERGKIMNAHLSTIQQKDEQIKKLEIDLAEMFQKMLQSEKQVRKELQLRFSEEKSDLLAQWDKKCVMELSAQQQQMEDAKVDALSDLRIKMQNDFDSEIANINKDYAKKIEISMYNLLKKENEVELLRKQLADMDRDRYDTIKEMNERFEIAKENHIKEIAKLEEQFQKRFEDTELEQKRKLEDLKLNLNARNDEAQVELTKSHKKQLDDLRSFFSLAMAMAKKDADLVKSQELERQELLHKEIIEKIRKDHSDGMKDMEAAHIRKMELSLNTLKEEYEMKIGNLNNNLEICRKELDSISIANKKLRFDHERISATLEDSRLQSIQKEKEFRKLSKEQEEKITKLMLEFNAQLKNDKENLQSEHLKELQGMLKEFESVRDYLRQEIDAKDIQLKDALKSKDDNLRKIADMSMDIEKLRDTNTSLKKQLTTYTLELKNREASFNKIFNNTPIVAEPLQPLKQKMKPKQKLPPLSALSVDLRSKSINF